MIWWWKSQLDSPDGATRNRAIAKLVTSLDHPSEDRRRKAIQLLAGIGHQEVVRWSLKQLTNRESAGFGVGLLTQVVTDFLAQPKASGCLLQQDPLNTNRALNWLQSLCAGRENLHRTVRNCGGYGRAAAPRSRRSQMAQADEERNHARS
jgi:hypothetical protein